MNKKIQLLETSKKFCLFIGGSQEMETEGGANLMIKLSLSFKPLNIYFTVNL